MFCGECGAQNPDTNQFCKNCGKPLRKTQQAYSSQPIGIPAQPVATPLPAKIPKKLIALILVVIIIAVVIAATGVMYVPGLSDTLGTSKPRDLGIRGDPAKFNALLARENVKLTGPASDYNVTADIRYENAVPTDVTVSSEELTSMMQAFNANGPLYDMQVRLGDNNQMEMATYADLTRLGYPVKGPVYLKGTFEKESSSSVKINLEEGSFGLIPLPDAVRSQAEDGIDQTVNKRLSSMPGMTIDQLNISNGQLHYSGAFPHTATAE
jgi:hypothetical protein